MPPVPMGLHNGAVVFGHKLPGGGALVNVTTAVSAKRRMKLPTQRSATSRVVTAAAREPRRRGRGRRGGVREGARHLL